MKKVLLSIFICVLIITGCTNKSSKKEERIYGLEGVTLSLNSFSNTEASLTLKNESEHTLYYGEEYFIQENQNNEWIDLELLNENIVHPILHILKPNNNFAINTEWEQVYGTLKNGKYRLVKSVALDEKLKENYYITCEFEITE